MPESDENKINTSSFWFIIVPISVLIILGLFLYIVFNINSVQTMSSKKVFELVKNLKRQY
jgi:hypothetical protein